MSFKKGTLVRQIMPAPFEGVVTHYAVDQETGDRQNRVSRAVVDVDGNPALDPNGNPIIEERYFNDDQIEQVPEEDTAEGGA